MPKPSSQQNSSGIIPIAWRNRGSTPFQRVFTWKWTYRVTPLKKNRTHKLFFITSTKIKQNNSNCVHLNFWKCWWILWSQFFMHRIYFISWKKKKRLEFNLRISVKNIWVLFFGGLPCNSATGVRTRLLRFTQSIALTITPRGHSQLV